MSWLQRIIDRDPEDAITVPEDPEIVKPSDMQPPSFEESASPASLPEADAVPDPDTKASSDKSILIVEDEAIVADDIKETLKSLGYDVAGIAKSGENALEMVKDRMPDLVLMDIHLSTAMDGIEAAGKIHVLYDIPVIYLTAFADKALLNRAKVTEPYGYIIKPYDERELRSTIDIAFHKHKLDQQLKKAYGELEQRVFERTVELEQINLALSESERRYRNLFEGVPIGIYRTTTSGHILDINPALVSLLGYPNREKLMKVDVSDLYMDPGDRKRWLDLVEREGIVRDFEVQLRKYNKTIIWVRDTGNAVYDDSGQVAYYNGNIEDITERRRAEDALQLSELRYRNLFENMQLGLAYCRMLYDEENLPTDFIYLSVNPAFNRIVGIPAIMGNRVTDVFPGIKEAFPELFKVYGRVALTGEPESFDLDFNPLKKWLHISVYSPAKEHFIAIIEDITLRRRTEEALQLEDFAITSSINAMAIADLSGNLTYVNQAFLLIWGYEDQQEVLGRQVLSFWLIPDEAQQVVDGLQVQGNWLGELTGQRKNGTLVQLQLSANLVRDNDGTPIAMMASFIDITDRKQADDALRASEQRYRDVVEDQTEFICRFLPDGRLTFVNEAYCNYFRLNRKEIIGKRHSVVLLPDDAQLMKNHLAALNKESPVALISHRIVLPFKGVRWQYWSDRAIFDNDGDVIEYQSVGRDITLLKETETQLKNYKETLEQRVRDRTSELSETNLKLKKEIEDRKIIQKKLTLSSNEKDLLLREVNHRVKNNLQLIIGLIDMTKTRAHEPAVISTLTDIMAKVQTMGLVHTRLYESKRFDKINMKRQVHDLVEMIAGFHDHDHLDITTNIDCAEIYLPVDQAIPCALALNEVIANIHKHAFSGRRNGLVDISSVKKADRIRFIIRDNGVGLPSGFNIEKSNRLGLKLMRTLVEQQLHGSVQISSKAGTEVVIEFPITRGEPDYGTGTGS